MGIPTFGTLWDKIDIKVWVGVCMWGMGCVCVGDGYVNAAKQGHIRAISQKTEDIHHTVDGPRLAGAAGWWKLCKNAIKTMIAIVDIGWCPRVGSEKSHYVHRWIVVCQKPGVLGWQFHTHCPRLEAIAGGCVCVGRDDVCNNPQPGLHDKIPSHCGHTAKRGCPRFLVGPRFTQVAYKSIQPRLVGRGSAPN